VILWMGSAALAGGYFYSDAGIVATGRGGAFVAGANNQFAQYYNPAGLIRIERPTFNLGLSGVNQSVTFDRLRPATETGAPEAFYEPARNEGGPFAIPQLGFATPLGEYVGFALGFYSPFSPSTMFEEEGPQRYSAKEARVYQFTVGPSIAVRPHPVVTLGVGLQWNYLLVDQTVDITVSGNDDPGGDIAVQAQVVDPFTLGINAGLLVDPVDEVSFGLSAQPRTEYEARGTGTLDFDGNGLAESGLLTKALYTDSDVALAIALPWVVRAGVAVRPVPALEIEAAVVWQDWSSLQDITIDEIDIEIESDSPIISEDQRRVDDTIVLPAGLRDTVSYRLGVEARVHDQLAVRAGGFIENAALTPQQLSVALVDTPKAQLGMGGSVFLLDEQLRFDASAALLLFRNQQIRDSTVTQIDAGILPDTVPRVIGNGDIATSGWVLGLQAAWSFRAKENK